MLEHYKSPIEYSREYTSVFRQLYRVTYIDPLRIVFKSLITEELDFVVERRNYKEEVEDFLTTLELGDI
jgi:hypothetical protein